MPKALLSGRSFGFMRKRMPPLPSGAFVPGSTFHSSCSSKSPNCSVVISVALGVAVITPFSTRQLAGGTSSRMLRQPASVLPSKSDWNTISFPGARADVSEDTTLPGDADAPGVALLGRNANHPTTPSTTAPTIPPTSMAGLFFGAAGRTGTAVAGLVAGRVAGRAAAAATGTDAGRFTAGCDRVVIGPVISASAAFTSAAL
jgi:hypothetical protein